MMLNGQSPGAARAEGSRELRYAPGNYKGHAARIKG